MSTTAAELADIRAAMVPRLPDQCTILRYSRVSDGAGGYTETWTADPSSVACRIAPSGRSAAEQLVAGRVGSVEIYVGTFQYDVTLGGRDQVRWETADRLLQVIGPGGRTTQFTRRALLVELDEEAGA